MDINSAMQRAIELAAQSPDTRPNPKVGCVIIDPTGQVVGEGFHEGAGTAHAEIVALDRAGEAARGATAVVSLEPCNHTGRTGPCAHALIAAGVARVVFAQSDDNGKAAGGAATLRAAGIQVTEGLMAEQARAVNPYWTFAAQQKRPYVIWKTAATLDGFVAAADGSSRWITGEAAREDVHRLRAEVDAVMVGTGTMLVDDPELTARIDGDLADQQPLRVVMGQRIGAGGSEGSQGGTRRQLRADPVPGPQVRAGSTAPPRGAGGAPRRRSQPDGVLPEGGSDRRDPLVHRADSARRGQGGCSRPRCEVNRTSDAFHNNGGAAGR